MIVKYLHAANQVSWKSIPVQNSVVCSELSSKLQDTLEMIEEQLDVALSKTCSGFDIAHYEKVQNAYRLLGKTQVVTGVCDEHGIHACCWERCGV